MSDEDFIVDKNESQQGNETTNNGHGGKKIIDESEYRIHGPQEGGPSAVGKGGDPLFRRIKATREQLVELMEETQTVQDWVQRETSNNVALAFLNNQNLKDIYFKIKDGFGDYGRMTLMGFKTPFGVEIPRLKLYDTNGDVIEVLTGPQAIDEINRRALAYQHTQNGYEAVPLEGNESIEKGVIADYVAPSDFT